MNGYVYLSGRILPEAAARIPVFDRGFLYGEGLFETLRAYRGRVFLLEEHLRRLRAAARFLEIPFPEGDSGIARAIESLIGLNQLSGARVRISLTPGPAGKSGVGSRKKGFSLCITAVRYQAPARRQKEGVRVVVSSIRRNSLSPLPRLKTMNYLESLRAREEARGRGAEEAIFLDQRGRVAEGAMSNIFLVNKSGLITPGLGGPVLPGVTRKVVMKLARDQGVRVREKEVGFPELEAAREVFLTNSLIEVLPVNRIGKMRVGAGRPGPVTRRLQEAYRELVRRTASPGD